MKRILATLAVVIGGTFVAASAIAQEDPHPASAGVRVQGGEGATSFTVPAPPDGWQWVSVYSKSANNAHRAQSTVVGATFTSGEFNANGVEQAISHVDLCKVRIVTTTTTTLPPPPPPPPSTSTTTTVADTTTTTSTTTTVPDTTTTEPEETTSTTTTVPDDSTTTSSTVPETTTTVPGETTTTEPAVTTTTDPGECVPVNEATRADEGNICGNLVETR